MTLPPKPTQRWHDYLDAESRGTRNQKLGSLDRFIASILEAPEELRTEWAMEFCRLHESKNGSLIIRQPLFERVLFPALMNSLQAPGTMRLLAGLFSYVYHSRTCLHEIPAELQSPQLLLREELRRNPDDNRAGLLLISLMAERIAYTLHELPSGVLYDMDGASPSQCTELLEYLEEFRVIVERFGVYDTYKEMIDDGTFHYHAYRKYLQQGKHCRDYREFLATHEER